MNRMKKRATKHPLPPTDPRVLAYQTCLRPGWPWWSGKEVHLATHTMARRQWVPVFKTQETLDRKKVVGDLQESPFLSLCHRVHVSVCARCEKRLCRDKERNVLAFCESRILQSSTVVLFASQTLPPRSRALHMPERRNRGCWSLRLVF
jgi:hypothetical protein